MRLAPGSGQDENTAQKAMVQELNWSHDQMFLAAVIHESVGFFDMNKLLSSINDGSEQKSKNTINNDQMNGNKMNSMQVDM